MSRSEDGYDPRTTLRDGCRQQVIDYVFGDAQAEADIAQVIRALPSGVKQIRHEGCGIGWLAHELKRAFPEATVVGVDDEDSVLVANRLFGRDGLSYMLDDPESPADGKSATDVTIIRGRGGSNLRATPSRSASARKSRVRLEPRAERMLRVRERLMVHPTRDGYLMSDRIGPTVLVVSPLRNAPSETFIKAQLEGLPTRVEALFGTWHDFEDSDGRPIHPRWVRALRAFASVVDGRLASRVSGLWLAWYMKRRGVRAVLAQYGPTGAVLYPVCRRISVPLVTQFLGYDASDATTLEEYQEAYRRLLRQEAATVAVSKPIERTLYGLGARPGSVSVIPCGVDIKAFAGADPKSNPPIFLAAGRFVEKKAPQLTLTAFHRVLRFGAQCAARDGRRRPTARRLQAARDGAPHRRQCGLSGIQVTRRTESADADGSSLRPAFDDSTIGRQ